MGILEEKREKGAEGISEEIMAENFPNHRSRSSENTKQDKHPKQHT